MPVKISIIQPGFLPWIGYFEQIAITDIFVYFDDVKYTKKDWRNRNRLKSPYGVKTISVPVYKNAGQNINSALINYNHPWQNKLIAQIYNWYKPAPYFNSMFPILEKNIRTEFELLVDLNYSLDQVLMDLLDIKTPIFKSSDIQKKSSDKNMKIIDICKYYGASLLYDGKAAENFIDLELFKKNGIQVKFQNYIHQPYPQLWGGDFISHLSVLDLLMNCGPKSKEILLSNCS
jgi:hypothetical protein